MPITQDRLAKLARAGQQIEQVYLAQSMVILEEIGKFRRGLQSIDQTLAEIEALCLRPEAAIANESSNIRNELTIWKLTSKKNERDRDRKERKRRSAGVQPTKRVRRLQDQLAREQDLESGGLDLGQAELRARAKGIRTSDIDKLAEAAAEPEFKPMSREELDALADAVAEEDGQ